MRKRKAFIFWFLVPTLVCLIVFYVYPTFRTVSMSFFSAAFVTDDASAWTYVGSANYINLFRTSLFRVSLVNAMKIWLLEGAVVILIALLFSVILTSGIVGKSFWRSMLYLPNVISAAALSAMWIHYVFNNQYGLFRTMFMTLGWKSLAQFQWTASENMFVSMMIAYTYASVGYYVLILTAGIDSIASDYYDVAEIEGAGMFKKTIHITVPFLKPVFKRVIILWTAGAIGFFTYSKLFTLYPELSTITPVVYMYTAVFGQQSASGVGGAALNVGGGAAVGVIVMIIVLLVNTIINRLLKDDLA